MLWDEWRKAARDENRWVGVHKKGLLKAEHLKDFTFRLWFEEELDVSIYDFNWQPFLLEEKLGSVLAPLRDIGRFRFVKGDYALLWPNPETGECDETAIDLAPECVRFFCERYGAIAKGKPRESEMIAA